MEVFQATLLFTTIFQYLAHSDGRVEWLVADESGSVF
jgi:hypothetical protein